MAIKINGITVIDNSRNLTNIVDINGANVNSILTTSNVATQAQAEAGTDNTTVMTPLRVSQAISSSGISGTAFSTF